MILCCSYSRIIIYYKFNKIITNIQFYYIYSIQISALLQQYNLTQFILTNMDYDGHFVLAQLALSNRSQCRTCKTKIEKGQLRIGNCYDDDHMRNYPWTHLNCFYLTKKFLDLNIQPSDIKGYSTLEQKYQILIADRILKLKSGEITKTKKSAKEKKGKGAKAKKQSQVQHQDQTKYKPGGYTQHQRNQFQDYKKQYQKFSIKQLQAMLQYNKQCKTGTKMELLQRVADGWLLGSIPKCPQCQEGKLKFNRFDGTYRCSGYFNQTYYQKCSRKFKRDQIQREEFA